MRWIAMLLMRWFVMLLVCSAATWLSGCDGWKEGWDRNDAATADPDDPLPGQPAYCDGVCVATPPATYTGPSLFWIGPFDAVQGCPPETPEQGIEGYVSQQFPFVFARECRVTPSDLCGEEGQTCAPMPRPEFHVCIHHDGDTACPPDYVEQTTMNALDSDLTVTLCCEKSPLPS